MSSTPREYDRHDSSQCTIASMTSQDIPDHIRRGGLENNFATLNSATAVPLGFQ